MHEKTTSTHEDFLQRKIVFLENQISSLKQENILFKNLVQSLQDMVFIHPLSEEKDKSKFTFVNKAVTEKLKYGEEELKNLSPIDLTANTQENELLKNKNQLNNNKEVVLNKKLNKKDGSVIPVELSIKQFEIDGKLFVITVGKDILQIEKTKEDLKNTEKSLQAIVNATQDIIMLIDLNTQIVYTNEKLLNLLNLRKIDIIGRKVDQVFDKIYSEKLKSGIKEVVLNKKSISYIGYLFTKKWNITLYPVFSDDKIISIAVDHKDLTAEDKAKKLVEENERRLRLIFEAANIGWWDYNYDSNTFKRSDYWYKILGYTKESKTLTPQFIESIIHPDDKNLFKLSFKLEKQKFNTPVEFRLLHADGNYRWIQSMGEIVEWNSDNTPKRSVGVHMDITQRKTIERKEQILLESYTNILNTARDAIYILDKEGKFIEVNRAAEKMYGYNRDFFIGKSPEFLSAPGKNNLNLVSDYLSRAYNGESIEFDFWGLRKNGEVFPKIVRVSGVNYLGSKAIAAFGLDITERYENQEKLRISEAKYKAIFNSIPLSVTHIDREGNITEVNNYHIEKISKGKKTLKDFIGSNVLQRESIIHAGLTSYYKNLLKGIPFNLKEVFFPRTTSGESQYFNITGKPLFSNGKQAGSIITTQLITDQIVANKKLSEAQDKLKLALDSSEAGIWDWKVKEEIFSIEGSRNRFKDLREQKDISLSVKRFLKIIHPEDSVRVKKIIVNKLRMKSENYSFDFRIKDKDNKWVWIFIKGKAVEWKNKFPRRLIGTFHDISLRKQNEIELNNTKEQLELAIQGSGIGIYSWDFKPDILTVDKNIVKSLGYTKHEITQISSKNFRRFVHKDDLSKVINIIRKQFTPNTPVQETEIRLRTPKGWHWFWVRGKAMRWDKNGIPVKLYGTYLDITEQKLAEFEFEKIEKNYRTIYENAPIALYRVSSDNKIKQCNLVAANLFGFQTVNEFLYAINEGTFILKSISYSEILSHMSDKNYIEGLIVHTTDNQGNNLWLESSFVLDKSKKFIDCFSINSTKRILVEKANKETNLKLKNLYRYMNHVREEERKNIARLVHDDLGQKLTALNLEIALLKNNCECNREILDSQFKSIPELIDDSIKTVQRISTELRPGILDDLGLLNAIQWQSNEFSRRSNLSFKLNLDKNEIQLSDDIKTQVFRVFQEALTNIIRHANAAKVVVSLRFKNGNLLFEIADNGVGISKEKINDTTSFGLISMKERIETVGGELKIDRKLSGGTIIKVSVPIKGKQ